jgi:glycosyltransferase involved in cell wall biosynthesis
MLSILLPVNRYTDYFKSVVSSLEKSVSLLKKPTQLIVVLNKLSSEEIEMVKDDLSAYPFEKTMVISNANDLSTVLNYGLSFCKYDLVARMDQDDISLPNRLSEQVSFLEINSNTSVVGGQVILINSFDQKIGVARYPVGYKKIHKSLKFKNCFAHPAVMYRKNEVLKIGGYSNKFPLAEDYYLWVRLSMTSQIDNLKNYVLKYRIHESQVSSENFTLQLASTIRVMALQFGVNDEDIRLCFVSIKSKEKKLLVREILNFNPVVQSKKFRAAIALMFLRRGSHYIGNSIYEKIYLIYISIISSPSSALKLILRD